MLVLGLALRQQSGNQPCPSLLQAQGGRAVVRDHVMSPIAQRSGPPKAVLHTGNNALVLVLIL